MQDKILVIGDSHTRAFSYNNNFFPVFLGQGRNHCFINSECLSNVTSKVLKIIKEIPPHDSVILFGGEPDTRFNLGRGWKPWNIKPLRKYKYWGNVIDFYFRRKSNINKSFRRYCQLINTIMNTADLRLFILNITPSNRKDQNKLVDYFNKLLSEFCMKEKDVEFISINKNIYNPKTKTVRPEYNGDPVHLNMKLQSLVEYWLIEKDILKKASYNEEYKMDKLEIKRNYKFNEKFGCYTL